MLEKFRANVLKPHLENGFLSNVAYCNGYMSKRRIYKNPWVKVNESDKWVMVKLQLGKYMWK